MANIVLVVCTGRRFKSTVDFHRYVCVAVLCHVYISMDSYLSIRAHDGIMAQELLQAVAERMDVPQGDLVLVAITYPGGKYNAILQYCNALLFQTTTIYKSANLFSSGLMQ